MIIDEDDAEEIIGLITDLDCEVGYIRGEVEDLETKITLLKNLLEN